MCYPAISEVVYCPVVITLLPSVNELGEGKGVITIKVVHVLWLPYWEALIWAAMSNPHAIKGFVTLACPLIKKPRLLPPLAYPHCDQGPAGSCPNSKLEPQHYLKSYCFCWSVLIWPLVGTAHNTAVYYYSALCRLEVISVTVLSLASPNNGVVTSN